MWQTNHDHITESVRKLGFLFYKQCKPIEALNKSQADEVGVWFFLFLFLFFRGFFVCFFLQMIIWNHLRKVDLKFLQYIMTENNRAKLGERSEKK